MLAIATNHTHGFAQSSATITVTLYCDAKTGSVVNLGDFSICGTGGCINKSVYAMAAPDPGSLNWNWSTNVITQQPETSSVYVDLPLDQPGSHTITVTASVAASSGSAGSATPSGEGTIDIAYTVVKVKTITPKEDLEIFLGDTLSKEHFVIETDPPGKEDMVDVTSVVIAPGDNLVTASCGVSHATTNIVGYNISVAFGAAFPGADGSMIVPYTVTSDADATAYSIAYIGSGGIVAGDTSGTFYGPQTYASAVSTQPTSSLASGAAYNPSAPAAATIGPLIRLAAKHGGTIIQGLGAFGTAAATYIMGWGDRDATVTPSADAQPVDINVSTTAAGWIPKNVTAKASCTPHGKTHTWGGLFSYVQDAQITVKVTDVSVNKVDFNGIYQLDVSCILVGTLDALDTSIYGKGATAYTFEPVYQTTERRYYSQSGAGSATLFIHNGNANGEGEHLSWGGGMRAATFTISF